MSLYANNTDEFSLFNRWKNYYFTGARIHRISDDVDCLVFLRDNSIPYTIIQSVSQIRNNEHVTHKIEFRNVINEIPINFIYFLHPSVTPILSIHITRTLNTLLRNYVWLILVKFTNVTLSYNIHTGYSIDLNPNVLFLHLKLCINNKIISIMVNGIKLEDIQYNYNTPSSTIHNTSPANRLNDLNTNNQLDDVKNIQFLTSTSAIGTYFYDCSVDDDNYF